MLMNVQQPLIFSHEKSTSVLQRKKISFVPNFFPFDFLIADIVVVDETQVKHSVDETHLTPPYEKFTWFLSFSV